MDASQLCYPEIVHLGPSFYVPKVSEIIWNTRKHHFGSNGLEWMLHNFGTPKIVHIGPKLKFCMFICAEGQRNHLKHSQTSFWVQWTRMNAYNFGTPEIVHLGPKLKFCKFICAEGQRNHLKYLQTSFWVQWTRLDASQLCYPEIVHLGPKQKFCKFLRAQG
jgi:hypothetical protein